MKAPTVTHMAVGVLSFMLLSELVPPITDSMGRGWEQPDPGNITVEDGMVVMHKGQFDMLKDYSHSLPTGVYEGKMWKRKVFDGWMLCWYGKGYVPNKCSINRLPINMGAIMIERFGVPWG